MNVEYSVEDLGAKGKGIICRQFVKEGSIVYSLDKDLAKVSVDMEDLEEYLSKFPDKTDILNHGYCSEGKFIDLQYSDARFTNHSFNPPLKYNMNIECSVAVRDIQPGEELTENYSDYDIPDVYNTFMEKYANGNFVKQSKSWE